MIKRPLCSGTIKENNVFNRFNRDIKSLILLTDVIKLKDQGTGENR